MTGRARLRWPPRAAGRGALVVFACLALSALSLVLPSAPAYDPWAWIIWGREVVHLELDTETGPSWKPLPMLFTIPFALAGDAAVALWVVVGRAGTLLAHVVVYRLAARFGGPFAGVLAAAGLLVIGTEDRLGSWFFNGALANSEGLLVAVSLLAVDRHLDGRARQAFVLGVAAALLRPEAWPFLVLYGGVLFARDASSRRLVAALLALVPVAWFGPDLVTSGDPFTASTRARSPDPDVSPAFAERPFLEVVANFTELLVWPVWPGVAIALVLAALAYRRRRREGALLALAAGGVAWVAIVAVMTEAGYAGNSRYLLVPAAIATTLASVGWARAVSAVAGLLAPRVGRRASLAAAIAVVIALTAASLPWTVPAAEGVGDQARVVRYHGDLYADVDAAIASAGGRDAVLDCGRTYTGRYHVPPYVWHLDVHFRDVSVFTEPPGTVFRAPPRLGDRPDPPIPETDPPFVRTGVAHEWEIYSTCGG